jgi:hypothetical protein
MSPSLQAITSDSKEKGGSFIDDYMRKGCIIEEEGDEEIRKDVW